jgi:hypothetical protein
VLVTVLPPSTSLLAPLRLVGPPLVGIRAIVLFTLGLISVKYALVVPVLIFEPALHVLGKVSSEVHAGSFCS